MTYALIQYTSRPASLNDAEVLARADTIAEAVAEQLDLARGAQRDVVRIDVEGQLRFLQPVETREYRDRLNVGMRP
jgi:hypothetical protein